MKTTKQFLLAVAFIAASLVSFAQVGIGTETPNANAVLDIETTNQGILLPRLTDAQRDAVLSPEAGLLIYNTTTNVLNFFNGTDWVDASFDNSTASTGTTSAGGKVGIGTASPSGSAALELQTTVQGLLLPRVDPANVTGVAGLLVYDTTANDLKLYNGSTYVSICGGAGLSVTPPVGTATVGGVGVNTATPHHSAILDLEATDKGLLLPRLTTTERDAIAPVQGLVIYNETSSSLDLCDGTNWTQNTGTCAPAGPTYPAGYVHCDPANPTQIVEVTTATGRTWMDRNLGAAQVATSVTDSDSFGDLFQWGRFADGHQCRTSGVTTTIATTTSPSLGNTWDGLYIDGRSNESDWLSTHDDTMWQGVSGINNPCPSGYRLPTENEFLDETNLFSPATSTGAFNSALKFPQAGVRLNDGTIFLTQGRYATSTPVGFLGLTYRAESMLFRPAGNITPATSNDQNGVSVRCIKD